MHLSTNRLWLFIIWTDNTDSVSTWDLEKGPHSTGCLIIISIQTNRQDIETQFLPACKSLRFLCPSRKTGSRLRLEAHMLIKKGIRYICRNWLQCLPKFILNKTHSRVPLVLWAGNHECREVGKHQCQGNCQSDSPLRDTPGVFFSPLWNKNFKMCFENSRALRQWN